MQTHTIGQFFDAITSAGPLNDALATVSFILKKQSRNHSHQEEALAFETIRRFEHVESVAERGTSHRMDHSKGPPSNLPP